MNSNQKILIAMALVIGVIIAASFVLTPKTQNDSKLEVNTTEEIKMTNILLETTKGNITIELRSDMPITAGNFEKLVSEGFYDGVIFHRVIPAFMVQGGDPLGDGTGGPGYAIKDEFTTSNRNDRGTIAMANSGPNSGGSQFFINVVNNNFLDTKHPAFGKIVKGMDVVDLIVNVPTDANDRPLEEVKIIKAIVQ